MGGINSFCMPLSIFTALTPGSDAISFPSGSVVTFSAGIKKIRFVNGIQENDVKQRIVVSVSFVFSVAGSLVLTTEIGAASSIRFR